MLFRFSRAGLRSFFCHAGRQYGGGWKARPGISAEVGSRSAEALEVRTLLAAPTMTAQEQLLLEFVNRSRLDPGAEAARHGIGLNDGVIGTQIQDVEQPPLAPHQSLITAAGWHSDDILDRNFFAHDAPAPAPSHTTDSPADGSTPQERGDKAGYPGSVGENIGINQTTGPIDPNDQFWVEVRHSNLFKSSGHRVNMLRDIYVELGTGVRFGKYLSNGTNWNAIVVTEKFGTYFGAGDSFLTGVVFSDATSGQYNDDFYSLGEGVGGGTITAYSQTSSDIYTDGVGNSGGYSLQVPDDTYSVVLELTNGTKYIAENVEVNGVNEKVDFELTTATLGDFNPPADPVNPDVIDFDTETGRWNVGMLEPGGSTLNHDVWANWGTTVDWRFPVTGDFNGDTFTDVAAWNSGTGAWRVGLSDGTAFNHSNWDIWNKNSGWHSVVVGDFTGDGNDDIAGRKANGSWFVAQSDGSGSFTSTNRGYWSINRQWSDVVVGDFDGDGKDDIGGRNDRGHWFINEGSAGSFVTSAWGFWNPNRTWESVVVADFDGDGSDDLGGLAADVGHYFVGISDGMDFGITAWGYFNRNGLLENPVVGDFNGNSRPDLAIWNSENGRWIVGKNITGDFDVDANFTSWTSNNSWNSISAHNLDGSGKDELLIQTGNSYYASDFTGGDTTPSQIGDWFDPHGHPLGVVAFRESNATWRAAFLDHDANGDHVLSSFLPSNWNANRTEFPVSGDFNGDGLTDVAAWDPNNSVWGVGLNTGSSLAYDNWGLWNAASGWQDVVVGDFNGDGNDDIAGRKASGIWFVQQSDGNTFTDVNWGGLWSSARTWTDVRVGDFNDDGFDDITGRNDNGGIVVAAGSASGFTTTSFGSWSTARNWQHVRVADVNGDNRTDLIGLAQDTGDIYVALSTGTSFNSSVWGSVAAGLTFGHGLVGNFAGDSKADYALWNSVTGDWTVAASLSNSFDVDDDFARFNPNGDWQQMIAADVDFDGQDEVLIFGRGSGDGRWFESDLSENEDPRRIATWTPESQYTDAAIATLDDWL